MRKEIGIRLLIAAIGVGMIALIAGCGAVSAVMNSSTVTFTVDVSGYNGGSISAATVQYTLPNGSTKTVTPASFPWEVSQGGYVTGLPIALRVYGTSSGGMMNISLHATSTKAQSGSSSTMINFSTSQATGSFDQVRTDTIP
jgi:hypothetical protein